MNFSSTTVLLLISSSSLTSLCSGFLTTSTTKIATKVPFTSSFVQSPEHAASSASSNRLGNKNERKSSPYSQLYSSKIDDEEEDESLSDELSKLIGKRASISSTKNPSSPTSTKIPKDNDEDAIIDPSVESMYDGKSGMDIFEMPDFKNKRPLKTPKESSDRERGGSGSDKDNKGDDLIDFMADYDDENDLHIPNRMGFSTIAWGDESQGFKSGKKLKKKAKKAGKFLAGDLQVSIILVASWY